MKPNPCTICGEPGIPGLISGCGKCQYHYNVGQFGQEWADKVKRDMTTPLYIFDLDGTLADLKHRRHFVEKPRCTCPPASLQPACSTCIGFATGSLKFKPNWDAFHAACVDDKPIEPVIQLLVQLSNRADIWIWSGRMATVRRETQEWLECNVYVVDKDQLKLDLKMRPAGDFTPDDQLKESWLLAMNPEDRARLVMVFDDRDRVVAMWRKHGIVCAQVAPGDF